jgi:hypothetical protein
MHHRRLPVCRQPDSGPVGWVTALSECLASAKLYYEHKVKDTAAA